MNRVHLGGIIVSEFTVQNYNGAKKAVSFQMRTRERWTDPSGKLQHQDQTHQLICHDRVADLVLKFLKVGDYLNVIGKLRSREIREESQSADKALIYTQVSVTELDLDSIVRAKSSDAPTPNVQSEPYSNPQPPEAPRFSEKASAPQPSPAAQHSTPAQQSPAPMASPPVPPPGYTWAWQSDGTMVLVQLPGSR